MDDLTPDVPARRPNPRPLRWAIPTLGLFLSGALLWEQRGDVAYLFSPPAAIDLGSAAGYHLERALPSRFARISGQPAAEVSHYRRGLFVRDLVPLPDVPVLVDRPHDEAVGAGAPLVFEGRLEPDVREPQLGGVVRYFVEKDELAPPGERIGTRHVWILSVGQRPWRPGPTVLWCLALLALVAFNATWLWRRLAR